MADSLGYTIFLDPADTVRAFEQRAPLQPTVDWTEMRHEQHAVAFTVAKVARLDLLRTFQASLDGVIRHGGTFEEWKSGLMPELRKAGWWGVVRDRDLTGTDEPVTVNERRLRTIYDTNARMSLATGHWRRIQRQKDVLPYLRYLPSTSERRRPLHTLWYGTLLPVDHPWWQTHFPPNGWFCKCHFEQVSERRRKRMGWAITDPASIAGHDQTYIHDVAATGEEWEVPAGIDAGFGYNPGTAHLRAVAGKAVTSIQQALDAGLDQAARQTLREIVDDVAFEQFMATPGGVFPIAILTEEQQSVIAAPSRQVVITNGIMTKQKGEKPYFRGHPWLTISEYRMLPDLVDNALFIGRYPLEPDSRIVYFKGSAGFYYKAVIRQDAGEPFPILVSFHDLPRPAQRRNQANNLIALVDRRTSDPEW